MKQAQRRTAQAAGRGMVWRGTPLEIAEEAGAYLGHSKRPAGRARRHPAAAGAPRRLARPAAPARPATCGCGQSTP
jgi:hypothetical protein